MRDDQGQFLNHVNILLSADICDFSEQIHVGTAHLYYLFFIFIELTIECERCT